MITSQHSHSQHIDFQPPNVLAWMFWGIPPKMPKQLTNHALQLMKKDSFGHFPRGWIFSPNPGSGKYFSPLWAVVVCHGGHGGQMLAAFLCWLLLTTASHSHLSHTTPQPGPVTYQRASDWYLGLLLLLLLLLILVLGIKLAFVSESTSTAWSCHISGIVIAYLIFVIFLTYTILG